jgi:hypothetical protein
MSAGWIVRPQLTGGSSHIVHLDLMQLYSPQMQPALPLRPDLFAPQPKVDGMAHVRGNVVIDHDGSAGPVVGHIQGPA